VSGHATSVPEGMDSDDDPEVWVDFDVELTSIDAVLHGR
jgi:hypothetical protein